ncbi:hypothetical protein APTSU1_000816800 [Apodemus speciosus]|uniref:Uncharacterized protein n=1 Tax=Apodemus speciosus TaxID=105296 RepID=A0ABQ0F0Y1_APOSI
MLLKEVPWRSHRITSWRCTPGLCQMPAAEGTLNWAADLDTTQGFQTRKTQAMLCQSASLGRSHYLNHQHEDCTTKLIDTPHTKMILSSSGTLPFSLELCDLPNTPSIFYLCPWTPGNIASRTYILQRLPTHCCLAYTPCSQGEAPGAHLNPRYCD